MVRLAAKPARRVKVSDTASVPAPYGGWNARDAWADMAATDAIILDDIFPTSSDVMLRKGYSNHVTGISGQVESLMAYNSPTANTLFCAAGTAFYNVTTAGAVGAAVQSGLTNARWQHINVATSGGNFLLNVNGSDKLRGYNGTAWWTDGDGTHDITGVDTANCIGISLFKTRVWLVEKSTLKVWYLPTNAIAGAANAINFQSIAKRGGYLMAMDTWTIDAGEGMDDHAVFVTSEGEVIVYKGTDPSSATTWALVGVWQIGSPLGRRCLMKMAGDLLYVSKDGVLPLSKALLSDRVNPKIALTDKIQSAMNTAAVNYGSNYGWQLLLYPKGPMLILNVPVNTGSGQHQYVMNTITGAWCRFTGWAANCFEIFSDEPYFGGNGVVCRAWDEFDDNGADITGNVKTAFNYFSNKGQLKHFKLARPIFGTNGTPAVYIGLNIDYEDVEPSASLTFSPPSYAVWDSSVWDTGVWGGGLSPSKSWQGLRALGYSAAIRMRIQAQSIEVRWYSTDFVFERGGVV